MLTGVTYDGGRENYPDRAVVNLAPRVRFKGADDRYRADVSYSPNVRLVATQNWSHAWSHDLSASGQYALGRLTTLDINEQYQDQAIFDFGEQFLPDGTVDVAESATYDRVERNFASVSLQHLLSPRWVVSGSVSHGFSNFEEPDQTDSETLSGSLRVNHTLSRRTSFGAGISAQYSVFDESAVSQGEHYAYLQFFGTWRYELNDDFRVEFQGGPTLQFIDPTPFEDVESFENLWTIVGDQPAFFDYARCAGRTAVECSRDPNAVIQQLEPNPDPNLPDLPPGIDEAQAFAVTAHPVASNPSGDTVSVTFFGNISLVYEWDDWVARGYVARRESNASGEGNASSVTSAGFSLAWKPSPKWDLATTFGWSLRQTLGSSYGLTGDATLRQGEEYEVPVTPPTTPPTYEPAVPPVYLAAVDQFLIAERNNEFEITQIVAGVQVSRTLMDNLTLNSSVNFLYQDTPRNRSETTRLRATVNLVYLFPEWKF